MQKEGHRLKLLFGGLGPCLARAIRAFAPAHGPAGEKRPEKRELSPGLDQPGNSGGAGPGLRGISPGPRRGPGAAHGPALLRLGPLRLQGEPDPVHWLRSRGHFFGAGGEAF